MTRELTQQRKTIAERVTATLVFVVLLVGVVTPIGMLIWQAISPHGAVFRGPAGAFISAASSPSSYFAPTLSSVQTDAGIIIVVGTFLTLRRNALAVEQTNKEDRLRLCIVDAPAI